MKLSAHFSRFWSSVIFATNCLQGDSVIVLKMTVVLAEQRCVMCECVRHAVSTALEHSGADNPTEGKQETGQSVSGVG